MSVSILPAGVPCGKEVPDILFRQKYGHLPMIFVEDFENGSDEDLKSQAAKIAWTL